MKPFLPLFVVILFFNSCTTVWNEDDKQVFYKACLDDAQTWTHSIEKSKVYCDCVTEKILKKYPKESDAIEHLDSLVNDPEIKKCKHDVPGEK